MPILHTFAVKCPAARDADMRNTLNELVAGTSSAHSPVAVGQLGYYTDFSQGYRWLCSMKMEDKTRLAAYAKAPAHDAGVAKMAEIMKVRRFDRVIYYKDRLI